MASRAITSEPKLKLIDFLKTCKENELYTFFINGNASDAKKYIHRMRVELSRMRDDVRSKGIVPRPFKVYVEEIIENKNRDKTKIVIVRTTGRREKIMQEVDEIMDEIAGGRELNV